MANLTNPLRLFKINLTSRLDGWLDVFHQLLSWSSCQLQHFHLVVVVVVVLLLLVDHPLRRFR